VKNQVWLVLHTQQLNSAGQDEYNGETTTGGGWVKKEVIDIGPEEAVVKGSMIFLRN
jgi:hypothetical protein